MSKFYVPKITNHPNIEPITARDYKLEDDHNFVFTMEDKEYLMRVYKGFKYDGASVPRLTWTLSNIRPDGLNRTAALIHDIIYVYKGILDDTCKYVEIFDENNKRVDLVFTRKDADRLFLEILESSGVNWLNRNTQFVAVSLGGNKYWKKPRTQE